MSVSVQLLDDTANSAPTYGVIPGLVWAYLFRPDGTIEQLPADQPVHIRRDGWQWLHLNLADNRACQWLGGLDLPAQALALLTSHEAHQQLHTANAFIYGAIFDLVRNLTEVSDDFAHLHFVMTERLLISGRHRTLAGVDATRKSIEQKSFQLPSVAALLELIVENVADGVDDLAERLSKELDKIEDNLSIGSTLEHHQDLGRARRTSVRLHRQLSGLRTLFHRLDRTGTDGLTPALRFAAGKIAQRLDALDHDIVEIRNRSRLLQEEIAVATAEQSNRALRVLTIITTIILPPTLIAGAFGMNLKGIPFAEDAGGFWYAVVMLLLSSAAVWFVIRKIGVNT